MTVLFCLFFQLFSAAHAEGWRDYIPTHEHYLKAHRWIIEHSSRETRLFLYTNIPSLFPVELLCQLREGAQKTAVLPGDSFRVQSDKAELDCKGLVQATFSKGTAGSVDTASGDPVITLTQGGADIATAGKPVSLQLPDYTLKVTHSDPSTLFSLRQNDQGSLILCKHGLAEATVATAPEGNANQKFLASANCRLVITGNTLTKKRFIFSQEALHPADAGVSRELLPYINYFELITKFGGEKLMGQQDIWLVIIKNGKADIKAPLMLQIDQRYPEPANCSLYTQASISGALVSAYQFKLGSQRNNTIKLHPDYRKYFISVVCAQSRGLLVSNLLTPDVQTINNQ